MENAIYMVYDINLLHPFLMTCNNVWTERTNICKWQDTLLSNSLWFMSISMLINEYTVGPFVEFSVY